LLAHELLAMALTSDSFCTVNPAPAITSALLYYGEVAALTAKKGPALYARGGRVYKKPATAARYLELLPFIIRPTCT
jgi:hypothetical protein